MKRLRTFVSRALAVRRNRQLDRDLREQIDAHLDEAIDDYMQQGWSAADARRAALRRFGGVTQVHEVHRAMRTFAWVEDARNDVRHAIRALRRNPGFAVVAFLTLALAIGAATAIFSVVDAALLRPVPYPHPGEIVAVTIGETFEHRLAPSVADIEGWRESSPGQDNVFARIGTGRLLGSRPAIVDAGTPERLVVGTASEDLLEVFGVFPILGRGIVADDTRTGAPPVVLVNHHYWQTRLHAAADVVGRAVLVDSVPSTVVGVLPAGFYPETMVWRPHVSPGVMHAMRGTGASVYARLRPGLAADAVARDLTARLAPTKTKRQLHVHLTSLYDDTTSGYGRTIATLSGAVVLIVLIACVNVAGLLLARGATRRPELAIRTAIGASRSRLVRQLLAESVVLALAGGAAGVILAYWTLDAIVALVPLRLPPNVTPAVNLQVLTFAVVVSVMTSIAFGLAPALKLSRTGGSTHVSAGRSRHGSALTRRGGQLLIVVEVAMAVVLVTGAALMIRSFSRILAIDVGFKPESVVMMEVVPVGANPEVQKVYASELVRSVRQIPGVAAAGAANRAPLDGSGSYADATVGDRSITIARRSVTPGYFEAVGLPLRQGRFPSEGDAAAAAPFAVLSESAARAIFPNHDAVGQQFVHMKQTWTVVGVVGDARNKSPLITDRERPDVYLAYQPDPRSPLGSALTVVVRQAGRIPGLGEQLRHAAESVGPRVLVEQVRSGRDLFDERVATPRQQTTLLSLLGVLGLLLTLVGIFGTTAYAVARRTTEVGIRMALGARPARVVATIVRDAAWPVALGITIGLAGAIAATRVIASFLFETAPTDTVTFIAVAMALGATALLAAWIPARRAAHVDPVRALRAE
jgi:putative ABC transport system permease protein